MSTSTDFLPAVATYIRERFADEPDRVVFVTPNKRTSLFLKRAYCDGADGPIMLPHFATMANFMTGFSDKVVAGDDEQLCILYNAYVNVLRELNPDQAVPEFDSFIFWGNMILSDFNELDSAMVDAEALFKNLKDVKEIQADYLDDEQREVIRRIWGEGLLPSGNTDFWKHIKKESGEFKGEMAQKFYALWEILSYIYKEFNAMMAANGLVSKGRLERETLERLRHASVEALQQDKIFVFVGHNELTKAQALVMARLKAAGAALFFWDAAVLDLFAHSLTGTQPRPMNILRGLVEEFPAPDDFDLPVPEHFATVDVHAVPSNIGQTKVAHNVLTEWAKAHFIATKDAEGVNPLRTAVILPDPDLLVPMLYAIPEDIDPVNIAMGIPYRVTNFATFFSTLISMQLRARKYHGDINYYYEDLQNVIMHPDVRLFNREASDEINRKVTQEKLYNVSARMLVETFPSMAPLFRPVKDMGSAQAVADYLMALFDWVEDGLDSVKPAPAPASDRTAQEQGYEKKMIRYFRTTVERLLKLLDRYAISMREHTFLQLFERVFAQRGIIASGQPLEGMQLLGVLETRAIDFDNVIILSMNERIYPKRQYSNSMLPNALRRGYGLPDFDSVEMTYAYCFYRMIVRSKRVTVLYDARPDGLGGGEVSRYVTQVRYLLPELNFKADSLSYPTATHTFENFSLAKDATVMGNLRRMLAGPGKRPAFSASALKTYLKCQLSFYLQYALGFREPEELVDYKTVADFGTIFHNVVQRLFSEAPGGIINAEVLRGFKADEELLHRLAVQGVLLSDTYDRSLTLDDMDPDTELTAEGTLIVHYVEVNVKNLLDIEIETIGKDQFQYLASEWNFDTPSRVVDWKIGEHTIRFKMSVDRIDRLSDGRLRLVDFKTGSDALTATSIDKIFSDEHTLHAIFQLFLYSQALLDNKEHAKDLGEFSAVVPVISATQKFATDKAWNLITISKNEVTDYAQVQAEFSERLEKLVAEIFNPEVPLKQTENDKNCRYCGFKSLCGRYPKEHQY